MNAPAVLKAVYATWKPVPTRKCLQLVFEIPIEQTEQAMRILGVPTNETSTWCAIARLVIGNGPGTEAATTANPGAPEATAQGQGKPSRSFKSLPRSRQAGIKLQDDDFCRWMYDAHREIVMKLERSGIVNEGGAYEENADKVLKGIIGGIISKTDLDKFPEAGEKWDALLTDFDTRSYARDR